MKERVYVARLSAEELRDIRYVIANLGTHFFRCDGIVGRRHSDVAEERNVPVEEEPD